MEIDVIFEETDTILDADFDEVIIIHDIPKEYGLITYDQNRVITVS